jgi:hypothetical protein
MYMHAHIRTYSRTCIVCRSEHDTPTPAHGRGQPPSNQHNRHEWNTSSPSSPASCSDYQRESRFKVIIHTHRYAQCGRASPARAATTVACATTTDSAVAATDTDATEHVIAPTAASYCCCSATATDSAVAAANPGATEHVTATATAAATAAPTAAAAASTPATFSLGAAKLSS